MIQRTFFARAMSTLPFLVGRMLRYRGEEDNLSLWDRTIAFEEGLCEQLLCSPSFETPTFGGLLRMKSLRGELLDPHGEERRVRRVSNHEGRDARSHAVHGSIS